MKLLYVLYGVRPEQVAHSGIWKKFVGQLAGFSELGYEGAILLLPDQNHALLYHQDHFDKIEGKSFSDIFSGLRGEYGVAYIRFSMANCSFIRLLKELQRLTYITVLEFPTYPIERELFGKARFRWRKKQWLPAIKGLLGALYLKTVIVPQAVRSSDILTAVSYEKPIHKKVPIRIDNGIDLSGIAYHQCKRNDHVLVLIGVANISYWHGFDRVIQGLGDYYQETGRDDIKLILVGDGEAKSDLERLAQALGISELVAFPGKKAGTQLDDLFNQADAAIGTLAPHRQNLAHFSSLKAREYCARGIPFLITDRETGMEGVESCIYKVPDDDTPVNMEAVRCFIEKQSQRNAAQLRSYAEAHFTWPVQLQKVVEEIQESGGK